MGILLCFPGSLTFVKLRTYDPGHRPGSRVIIAGVGSLSGLLGDFATFLGIFFDQLQGEIV